ncbi:poly-gamma-glutamate biosynthesis protein PgsC/CapC [bacterium]|nr:poly-gamma-glutamate biosynthesis protein PgsC/CapC [candidate division CSSED10-310 bacterium]
MTFGGLPVFPESGLSNSVLPPVYIGLGLAALMTETLGWPFLSLMVPGYLAPILLIKPISGIVIIIEAFLAYLLMRLFSDGLSRLGLWNRFFGTDAFYMLLLISILVKSLLEGYAVPAFGPWLNSVLPFALDYRNELHGIGLVVVPLLANLLWRYGLKRGLVSAGLTVGLTYLVTRYLLIPYTNYKVSSFELMYEKIAIDFMESPKFYIILLVGAGLATLNRDRFGWTTHGILIPALLGIAWFTPVRVFTTFVEAGIICLLSRRLLKSRFMGDRTIEGPRKVLLLFSIGFMLKMCIGFVVANWYPGFKATDIYGFAYLLPTLMAIEMFPDGRFWKASRLILQSSLAAAFFGVLVGFAVSAWTPGPPRTVPDSAVRPPVRETGDLLRRGLLEKARLLPEKSAGQYDSLYTTEWNRFQEGFTAIRRFQDQPERRELLSAAEQVITPMGYELRIFHDLPWDREYLLLHERGETSGELHGWGMYLFDPAPETDLVIEVPRPLAEEGSLEAGLALFMQLRARALFIAGCYNNSSLDRGDVLYHRRNVFNVAHHVFCGANVVQVRSGRGAARLFIERDPGGDLQPRSFVPYLPELAVSWERLEDGNVLRQNTRRGFATLRLNRRDGERLVTILSNRPLPMLNREQGSLLERIMLTHGRDLITGDQVERYRAPTLLELVHLDREVFTPLAHSPFRPPRDNPARLRRAALAAFVLDLRVTRFEDLYSGLYHTIVERTDGGPYWGTYIFRDSDAARVMVEAPNPMTEFNTARFAFEAFSRLRAGVLFLSGMSARPGTDDPDVTDPDSLHTVFQLVHQVTQRENVASAPLLALQVRGFSPGPGEILPAAVVSSGYEQPGGGGGDAAVETLETMMRDAGIDVRVFDGSLELVRFGGHDNAQMAYTEAFNVGSFATLWLSSDLRALFPAATGLDALPELAAALDLPFTRDALFLFLLRRLTAPAPPDVEDAAVYVDGFITTGNIAYLARLITFAANRGNAMELLREPSRMTDFVVLRTSEEGAVTAVFALQPLNNRIIVGPSPAAMAVSLEPMLNDFLDGHAALLRFE